MSPTETPVAAPIAVPHPTSLIHLYRGELGRMAIYRVRLDTTTNWAIGVNVAVTTFALGQPDAPHTLMLLPYVLTMVFLYIEGRRFRELEVFRTRVRALERGYFAPTLQQRPVDAEWAIALGESLSRPHYTMTLTAAMAHRVRRNYLWLFLSLYGGWWMKLWLVDPTIVPAAAIGSVTGPVVIGLATVLLLPWFALSTRRGRTRIAPMPTEDDDDGV